MDQDLIKERKDRLYRPLIEASPLQKVSGLFCLGIFWAWEKEFFLFGISLLLLFLFLLRKRKDRGLVLILITGFIYGLWHFYQYDSIDPQSFPPFIKVKVISPVINFGDYSRTDVLLDTYKIKARVYAFFPLPYKPGDILEINARWKVIKAYHNPFAYEKGNIPQGVFLKTWLYSAKQIEKIGHKKGLFLQGLRQDLFHFSQGLSPFARGLFEALILGEKSSLPLELRIKFNHLGISHFLAVSGLHLTILVSLAWSIVYLFSRACPFILLLLPRKIWTVFLGTILCSIYVVLSGPSPSALRAMVMLGVYLVALLLYREARGLDIWAFMLFIVLVFWPEAIGSLSFRLSITAVLGLILANRFRYRIFLLEKEFPFWISFLLNSLYYSIAATIFTLPLVWSSFGSLSLLTPLSNLIAFPFFAFFLLPLEFAVTFLIFIDPAWAYKGAELAGKCMDLLPFPSSFYILSPPYPIGAFLITLLILIAGYFLSKNLRFKLIFSFIGLILALFFWFSYKNMHIVTFLDVGQGSASWAKIGKSSILFDAGPRRGQFDTGYWIIAPYLRKMAVKHLEAIVISHPQKDHIGGLSTLLKEIPVQNILVGANFQKRFPYEEDLSFRKIIWIKKQKILKGENYHLYLWPGLLPQRENYINRESLVARICQSHFCFLFPGDIDKIREKRLLKSSFPLASKVLLLPHHGSRYSCSEAFLKAVSPWIGITSSRSKKHPHPVIEKRLESLGIKHLETKKVGAISIIWDRKKIFVCTEKARRQKGLFLRALWPYIKVGCQELKQGENLDEKIRDL